MSNETSASKVTVDGVFNAERILEIISAALVGRTWVYPDDKSRTFAGTISVTVAEVTETVAKLHDAEELRLRNVSQPSNGEGVLSDRPGA